MSPMFVPGPVDVAPEVLQQAIEIFERAGLKAQII